MNGHLLPTGAGRAIMDDPGDPLHRFTLGLARRADPTVLFLGTATGDDPTYIVSFYETYTRLPCRPRHLRLFHRTVEDLEAEILDADVIHVGGGNTANALDVWRRQGIDHLFARAYEQGAVLTGGSAGGLCWFEGGTTDSWGPTLRILGEGLGVVPGSFCPHYEAEDQRRPLFLDAVARGELPEGYAVDNRVALHFEGGRLLGAVSSQPGGRAFRVRRDGDQAVEDPIEVTVLERSPGGPGRVSS